MENVTKVNGTWSAAQTVVVQDGSNNTVDIRIQSGSNATTEPLYPATITGVFGQFDNSSPFTSGYQIMPRENADLLSADSITVTLNDTSILEDAGMGATNGTVTLSVPAPIGGLTVTLSSSDTTEANINPPSVFIDAGNTTASFSVNAENDAGIFDANALVTITGSATGWSPGSAVLTVVNTDVLSPTNVVISQYYQDNSTASVFIEITNISGMPLNLTGWTLGQFYAPDAEGWANNSTADDQVDLSALGTIPAGGSRVIGYNGSIVPANTTVDLTTDNLDLFGTDSVALYNGAVDFANLVDVVALTDTDIAENTSLVRQNNSAGFSTIPGESYLDFPSVWSVVSLATVNSAPVGVNNHLGTYPGGASGPATFAAYIALQSGSGGNGTTDDKNNNGVTNIEEYAFDSDRANSPAGDITNLNDLRDVANGSLFNNATNSTVSDDRLQYTLTIPNPAPHRCHLHHPRRHQPRQRHRLRSAGHLLRLQQHLGHRHQRHGPDGLPVRRPGHRPRQPDRGRPTPPLPLARPDQPVTSNSLTAEPPKPLRSHPGGLFIPFPHLEIRSPGSSPISLLTTPNLLRGAPLPLEKHRAYSTASSPFVSFMVKTSPIW
ncbi:MAG: lamin tail domain-containing protein [Bdellovibrionaceae bacterium]|nr:lamin tail domain-containing protein [Pseudobdellovibrionaceae bacterium]